MALVGKAERKVGCHNHSEGDYDSHEGRQNNLVDNDSYYTYMPPLAFIVAPVNKLVM